MTHLDIAVFASGSGSNFESIAEMISREKIDANIRLVISNVQTAFVIQRAEKRGIQIRYLNPVDFENEEAYVTELLDSLESNHVNFIVLAGYLKLIPTKVVQFYHNRIINIHPALLPSFGGKGMYGLCVHQAVLEHGCKVTGATIHVVDEKYDSGPIILQQSVPVCYEDSPETLAKRVLEVEHKIFPSAVKLFAEERILIDGRRVKILEKKPAQEITTGQIG